MIKTKLSTKGQITIPKELRFSNGWDVGLEFLVIETENGLLLKPLPLFEETTINDVVGSANYSGKRKSLEEMEQAIQTGAKQDR